MRTATIAILTAILAISAQAQTEIPEQAPAPLVLIRGGGLSPDAVARINAAGDYEVMGIIRTTEAEAVPARPRAYALDGVATWQEKVTYIGGGILAAAIIGNETDWFGLEGGSGDGGGSSRTAKQPGGPGASLNLSEIHAPVQITIQQGSNDGETSTGTSNQDSEQ